MTRLTPREINEKLHAEKQYDAQRAPHEDDLRNEREEVIETLRDAERTIRILQDYNRVQGAQLSMLDKILNVVNGRQHGEMYGQQAAMSIGGRYDALADRLEAGSKK